MVSIDSFNSRLSTTNALTLMVIYRVHFTIALWAYPLIDNTIPNNVCSRFEQKHPQLTMYRVRKVSEITDLYSHYAIIRMFRWTHHSQASQNILIIFLPQAVMRGYWLLLEDLDYAPMDVISILVPLLESRTLPVPGEIYS